MAETLGSLCDKLTIVKLKQWHTEAPDRLATLSEQEKRLIHEINDYMGDALTGAIPAGSLSFAANKVYPKNGNLVRRIEGSLGILLSELAQVNCGIWHEQEKVYSFEQVPPDQKDAVIKRLAILNLERSVCTEAIDETLLTLLAEAQTSISARE